MGELGLIIEDKGDGEKEKGKKEGALIRRVPGEAVDSRSFSAGWNNYIPASEGDRSLEVPNYATLRFGVKGRPKPLRVLRLPWNPGGRGKWTLGQREAHPPRWVWVCS